MIIQKSQVFAGVFLMFLIVLAQTHGSRSHVCLIVFYCMLVILHQNTVLNMRPIIWEQYLPGITIIQSFRFLESPRDGNPDHK